MTSGKAIFARLSADAGVGPIVSTRIFPEIAPEGSAYPKIVYSGESAAGETEYGGGDGNESQSVRVACLALDYATASDLADRVKASLDEQEGEFGGVVVQGFFFESQTEGTESDDSQGPGSTVYVIEQQYTIWVET